MALELLQVSEAVAREKNITKESVIEAMEQAIQMAARRKYGMHLNVIATIDRLDGSVHLKKGLEVVEEVMEPVSEEEFRNAHREGRDPQLQPAKDAKGKPLPVNDMQITLAEAKKHNPQAQLGEMLLEDLPPMDFGRVAAQAAKQVIFQKVRDAEREKEYAEYANRAGEIISGIVKRADHHGLLVDLGKAEAYMPRDEMIPRETYRQGDRVRAYIYKVEQQTRGPQIFLSRTHPNYLIKLFEEEVPEIGNGVIEVMGAARDAGFRAKIAVKSHDHNLDPVGACVGIRGVRVQAVTNELQGERIDIIQWNSDPAQFLVAALSPAEVTKVVLDEEDHRMEVVVPEDKLSLAIGRRGQNVRLASILTGWDIDIMSEQEESERRTRDYDRMNAAFQNGLDVDDTVSRLLISEGFTKVEELLMVSQDELANIEGFDNDIAEELQNRARAYVESRNKEVEKQGVSEDLRTLEGMSLDLLSVLVKNGIKTRDDFAELATDELLELLPEGMLKESQAETMIMAARKHWFEAAEQAEQVAAEAAAGKAAKTASTGKAAKAAR